jgi:exodeoxyribonuclease-3
MRIISWNTNGLRATIKQGHFTPLFSKYKPDVVCLQETKVEAVQIPDDVRQIAGYHEYFSHSKARKGYSGVAIYTREKPISVIYDIPQEIAKRYELHDDGHGDPNNEGRVLALELADYYIVTVYTPNSKGDLSRLPLRHEKWDPAFLEFCQELEANKPVIFCGDLNVAHEAIDLARPEANEGEHGFTTEEREGINNIMEAGFVDTFRYLHPDQKDAYSYWDQYSHARERNVGWRIDYFFVSQDLLPVISKAEILADYYGSDHCPILLDIA